MSLWFHRKFKQDLIMLLFILKKRDKWIFTIIQREHSTK